MSDDRQTVILEFVRSLGSGNRAIETDTDLIVSGALDSMSVMELIAFLSKTFDVTIPVSDVTPVNLRSVTTLAALVEARSV